MYTIVVTQAWKCHFSHRALQLLEVLAPLLNGWSMSPKWMNKCQKVISKALASRIWPHSVCRTWSCDLLTDPVRLLAILWLACASYMIVTMAVFHKELLNIVSLDRVDQYSSSIKNGHKVRQIQQFMVTLVQARVSARTISGKHLDIKLFAVGICIRPFEPCAL